MKEMSKLMKSLHRKIFGEYIYSENDDQYIKLELKL